MVLASIVDEFYLDTQVFFIQTTIYKFKYWKFYFFVY